MKIIQSIIPIAFLLSLQAKNAFAIDLQPGEIRAPKPDVNFVMTTYIESVRGDRYVHGNKVAGDPEINAAQLLVRLGHSFEIADHPALFYVQVPVGYVHPQGSLSKQEGDSGVGDTTFLLVAWPYANHETQTYFGVGAYLSVPTGSYDHKRLFNVGENRYRTALQAGYQAPLIGSSLHWMAAIDAVRSGDNTEFGRTNANLEQKVLYTEQVGVRYDLSSTYSLGATYFHTSGGETSINGVSRDDTTQLHRYQLSGIANFTFGRVTLQYGADMKTDNGYIEDRRCVLRYTTLF